MEASEVIAFLAEPGNRPETLLEGDPPARRNLIKPLLSAIAQPDKRAKNRAAKLLARLSETHPQLLRRHLDVFIGLLEGDDAILLWNAMAVIGRLASVDTERRIDSLVPRLRRFFKAESMITTAHAIGAIGRIAAARPALQSKIANWLTQIDRTPHAPECREILVGKAIEALDLFAGQMQNRKSVVAFAESHRASSRPALRKKIEAFLRKYGSNA